MALGLAMGAYAFGGLLPSPSFVGAYEDAPRVALRGLHVVSLTLGLVAVAASVVRSPAGAARERAADTTDGLVRRLNRDSW